MLLVIYKIPPPQAVNYEPYLSFTYFPLLICLRFFLICPIPGLSSGFSIQHDVIISTNLTKAFSEHSGYKGLYGGSSVFITRSVTAGDF